VSIEDKRNLRPRYLDSGTKRLDNERVQMQEREKAKEKERIQREQEEMHRLEVMERDRQNLPPTVHATAKKGSDKADYAHHMPATKPKNSAAVFEESKNASVSKLVMPKTAINRGTFNVSQASASTSTANQSVGKETYDMTPLRVIKPATAINYDISDLRSSDETDDEDHPRKEIPAWAKGGQLKMALTKQYYTPPDLDELFAVVQMPNLATMFTFQRKRFLKRTSSAKWDSPIHPHSSVDKQ